MDEGKKRGVNMDGNKQSGYEKKEVASAYDILIKIQ